MALFSEHEVIRDSDRNGFGKDDGIHEERIQGTQASNIQVEVHATVVVEHEVAYGVSTLDSVLVVYEGVEKPPVVLCNEVSRGFVCPQHVFTAEYVRCQMVSRL